MATEMCVNVCLYIYLSIYRSIDGSIGISVYRSIYPSIYLSISASVCLSVCLSIFIQYIYISTSTDHVYICVYLYHTHIQLGTKPCNAGLLLPRTVLTERVAGSRDKSARCRSRRHGHKPRAQVASFPHLDPQSM